MSGHEALLAVAPSRQNVVDIFAGEWSSIFPPDSGLVSGGHAQLFEDGRIVLLEHHLGPVAGTRVLELGPLEGAHGYMLARLGAAEVVCIEGNPRAYLRTLCVKELFDLTVVKPMLGDFMPFLSALPATSFDIALGSGVLYHMTEPLRLLDHLTRVADRLCLWTHVWDDEIIRGRPDAALFDPPAPVTLDAFACDGAVRRYPDDALEWRGFSGGGSPHAVWLSRDGILAFLRSRGFAITAIEADHPDHPNGPALAIYARREGSLA